MEFYLIASLFSLGFFGGFSHCIGMCGPFVITQVSSNLQKTSLTNFNFLTRLKNCSLIPYHCGRILTYSLIAFISKIIVKSFDDTKFYKIFSSILLIIGAFFFLKIFLDILKKLSFFNLFFQKLLLKMKILFANPRGINGFILGIILGFLPCGLIYGAVAITLNFSSPLFSAIGMIIFGSSTFIALFFTGFFGGFILKIYVLKIFTKSIILLNIAVLLMLAFKQILS